jgi:replication factor A1
MQQTENLAPHVQEITRALQNRMEPEAVEDELRRYLEYGVPLAQAKRDIVRMHGGQLVAGEKKLVALVPEEKGIELAAVKILTVNPKEITVKGAAKTIWYGLMADDTHKISYTAWKDFQLERNSWVKIRNAYAKKGFREGVELSLGDFTIVEAAADPGWAIADDFQPSAEGASSRISTERKVREIKDGLGSVAVTARILEANEKTISTANGQKTLVEGVLADETGRIGFSAWEPEKLPEGFRADAVVHIKGAYTRSFRGVPNLNFGQYASVDLLAADVLPDAASLTQDRAFHLGELEATGGGEGILVEGVVLEVKKGSGIIFRCGHMDEARACNRVLQKNECRIHGKQKGQPDLRIKAVLDDGHGAATFFANREATERILGKSLAQAQEEARDAMTVDVIQDQLVEKLTARRVVVRGKALSDEFGLQIIASDVEYAAEKDATVDAEKLLGALAEMTPEVGQ